MLCDRKVVLYPIPGI